MRIYFLLFGSMTLGQRPDELPENWCDDGAFQMSEDVMGSGNKSFSTDLLENDTDRKLRRTSDTFDVYTRNILEEVITTTAVINFKCTFIETADVAIDENLAVFETPSPYVNNMKCTEEFLCSNPNHTVHFEFEYFETESGYDKLLVNGLILEGKDIFINEWINSFSSKVDLEFKTDGSVTMHGFKMNLKCALSLPLTNCTFIEYADGAIFDTGNPYPNRTRTRINN